MAILASWRSWPVWLGRARRGRPNQTISFEVRPCAAVARGGASREIPMSRMGHDFSWHVFALVMVVAGLSLLAPLAWWQAHEGRSFGQRTAKTLRRRPIAPIADEPIVEPQVAPLRPLVADQID